MSEVYFSDDRIYVVNQNYSAEEKSEIIDIDLSDGSAQFHNGIVSTYNYDYNDKGITLDNITNSREATTKEVIKAFGKCLERINNRLEYHNL